MRTFLPISRRLLNVSPRYFRGSPKIEFSALDFEGFRKIRIFFNISKILNIQNFKDTRKTENYELLLGVWCLTDKDPDIGNVFLHYLRPS